MNKQRTYEEKRQVIIEAFQVDLLTREQAQRMLERLAENRKAAA